MENLNKKIKVILLTTGGTIEKTYDEYDGSLTNKDSIIKHSILTRLRLPYTELEVHSILAMDSLDMQEMDRQLILQSIEKYLELEKGVPIVILHGTDNMDKTAQYCIDKIKIDVKVPIIFTGAMKPLGFDDSDAKQNVTEALLAAKIMVPGIYISFHNRIFMVSRVRKNRKKRTFEEY